MASSSSSSSSSRSAASINEALTDDELRSILGKLEEDKEKEIFGLVCKRWLRLQSTERRKLAARAGPHMLQKMAARFSRLLELDLSQSVSRSFYPGVTDSDLAVIADGFKSLRILNLHDCKGITDRGITSIGKGLPALQSLDVSYCRKLSDKGLSAVAEGCPNLKTLHLAGCRFVTDGILKSLSTNCSNLEELGLQGCSNITDSGLEDLVASCHRIQFLDINKCKNVGDSGITSVAKACSASLKTLKLLDCYRVNDESIVSLARHCTNLETLIIGGCRDITDESMMSLADSCCESLRNLRMDWCLNVTDCSLRCVLSKCRSLEALDVGCCEEVTDAAFEGLGIGPENGMRLKVLKVSSCRKITVRGISMVIGKCRSLEYLDVRSCPLVTKMGCDEAGLQFPESCKVNFNGSLNEPDVLV